MLPLYHNHRLGRSLFRELPRRVDATVGYGVVNGAVPERLRRHELMTIM
jgi:hypothetical protein